MLWTDKPFACSCCLGRAQGGRSLQGSSSVSTWQAGSCWGGSGRALEEGTLPFLSLYHSCGTMAAVRPATKHLGNRTPLLRNSGAHVSGVYVKRPPPHQVPFTAPSPRHRTWTPLTTRYVNIYCPRMVLRGKPHKPLLASAAAPGTPRRAALQWGSAQAGMGSSRGRGGREGREEQPGRGSSAHPLHEGRLWHRLLPQAIV